MNLACVSFDAHNFTFFTKKFKKIYLCKFDNIFHNIKMYYFYLLYLDSPPLPHVLRYTSQDRVNLNLNYKSDFGAIQKLLG